MEKNADRQIKQGNRVLWMDVLNIFSCISVVILHTTNVPVHGWNGVTDMPYLWGLFTHTAFICAVPIFIMLSGANLLNRDMGVMEFFKRRFVRVGIPFLVWSIVYWLLMHKRVGIKEFWELFLHGQMNPHMWFFIPLFSVYFSVPFMRVFLKHANRRLIECYLLTAFVLTSFFPFLYGSLQWFFPGYIFPLACQYLFLAVLGYNLNTYEVKWSGRTIGLCYAAAFLFHFGYLLTKTQLLGHSDNQILHYEAPSIVLMSACLFLAFKRASWNRLKPHAGIVMPVAACSFGIYLIHYIFVTWLPDISSVLKNCYWEFIPVYLLSFMVVWILRKIPVVRKCV